jgi:hypothetical protein
MSISQGYRNVAIPQDLLYSENLMILFTIFTFVAAVQAADSAKPCFDFSTKVTTPLKAPPEKYEAGKDLSESHATEKTDIAQISGVVEKPILEIYQKLLDPKTLRNDEHTEIKTKETESKDYLKRITQSIKIKPVFFLTLEWNEEWVYAVKDGTAEAPKTMVISFEKTAGTSHIQHECGSYVLKALSPTSTGVFIYEEMKADRRDAKDLLNDITGTLRTLRGLPDPNPKAKTQQYKS